MELRSSRSRSRTPFVQLTRLEYNHNGEHQVQQEATTNTTSTSTMKEETIVRRTYQTRNSSKYAKCKTSDYSSEEDVTEEMAESTDVTENGVKSALQIYQEAGEYWNKFPKTDYTYSSSSKDRIEVAPGVIQMPNMSRKSLRRSMEPTSTSSSTLYKTHDTTSYETRDTTRQTHSTLNKNNHYSSSSVNARRTLNFTATERRESIFTRITRIYRKFTYLLFASFLWITQNYYKTVSRLFLFDTWLMQKTQHADDGGRGVGGGGGRRKYTALFAIMLIPLLLFAGWMLWTLLPSFKTSEISEIPENHVNQVNQINKANKGQIIDVNMPEIIKQVIASPELAGKFLENGQNEVINKLRMELHEMKQENRRFLWQLRKCCNAAQAPRVLQVPQVVQAAPRVLQDCENLQDIRQIIQDELRIYDADKTGRVDYALESSGGQIISTRCTENYHSRTAVVSVLGVPLWWPSNTPRVIITPGAVPGECWAFQNFPGFVLIQLSAMVEVTSVSVEHIPASLAPGAVRDSAPRAFTVWGLKTENDREPWSFGQFEYSLEGPALQHFAVHVNTVPVNLIELRVESNHGNMNYTCLYRFRVHGNPK